MVYHRKLFVLCFERIEQVDEKLRKCRITINNKHIKRLLRTLLVLIICHVLAMAIASSLTFDIDSIWWYALYLPLILNPVSKLWFVAFVEGIRCRFVGINECLEDMRTSIIMKVKRPAPTTAWHNDESILRRQRWRQVADKATVFASHGSTGLGMSRKSRQEFISREFAQKLIAAATERKTFNLNRVNYVRPAMTDYDLDIFTEAKYTPSFNSPSKMHAPKQSKREIFEYILRTLCFLHDDICDISTLVNQMFSSQMLIMMAYAFAAITAQLYFVYCGLVGQVCAFSIYSNVDILLMAFFCTAPKYIFPTDDSAVVSISQ